jgi:hypothetical protein
MNEGSLILTASQFRNCEEKGVNVNLGHRVDLRQCSFSWDTSIPATVGFLNYRAGVYLGGFALNANVDIDINVNADLTGTTTFIRGVSLKGGNVGAGTSISIFQSNFSIRSFVGFGIYMEGMFPETSETNIYNNDFFCSSPEITAHGIFSEGGDISNLYIYGNRFGSIPVNDYANGITLLYSSGIENNVADNSEEYGPDSFCNLTTFQNTTVCQNVITSTGVGVAFNFGGTNTGTDFVNNIINGFNVGVDIGQNSLMGPQPHKGNEWHPIIFQFPLGTFTYRSSVNARCQTASLVDVNKFTVHTNQSIWNSNTNTYDFFSEFHPETIIPDVNDEFFGIQAGTPSTGCSVQMNGPGEEELERMIADGLLQAPAANPSMEYIAKAYLYKKLKGNPSLVGNYAPYATFLSTNANTNVGRFYEVGRKIELAHTVNSSLDQQSMDIMDDIEDLLALIGTTDAQLEEATLDNTISSLAATKSDQLDQLRELQADYDAVFASYKALGIAKLQEALALVQQITPVGQLEGNEKVVTEIYLLSVLNQGGSLTEAQVTQLKDIGEQCPEIGGTAVLTALRLLPDCMEGDMDICKPTYESHNASISSRSDGVMLLESRNAGARVYPNPASTSLFVNLPKHVTAAQLSIADMNGKILLKQHLSSYGQQVELVGHFAPGFYLVTIQMDSGERHTEKLVIQSN